MDAPIPTEALEAQVDSPTCWTNHLGIWAIEPFWFMQAVELFRHGCYNPPPYAFFVERFSRKVWAFKSEPETDQTVIAAYAEEERQPYQFADGVAVIPVEGPLTKARSKFGGASTLDIKRAVRAAIRDDQVNAILLHVESPGGHVAGIQDLADEIRNAASIKPLRAHIDDVGASAAYWLASQSQYITANKTAEVGSIGTMAAVIDESARMDRLGIKVHVLSTGPYKGIGVTGTPLDQKALDYLQGRVNDLNLHFLGSIQRGRPQLQSTLEQVSDGRVFSANTAKSLGLIDAVMSFDDAFAALCGQRRKTKRMTQQSAELQAFVNNIQEGIVA
jgi:signal peptide peptidase SppA